MKNTIINIVLLLSSLAFSTYASGQSSVWATAESIETVNQNEEFQYLQAHLGIEVTQPLSNSRQPHLQMGHLIIIINKWVFYSYIRMFI